MAMSAPCADGRSSARASGSCRSATSAAPADRRPTPCTMEVDLAGFIISVRVRRDADLRRRRPGQHRRAGPAGAGPGRRRAARRRCVRPCLRRVGQHAVLHAARQREQQLVADVVERHRERGAALREQRTAPAPRARRRCVAHRAGHGGELARGRQQPRRLDALAVQAQPAGGAGLAVERHDAPAGTGLRPAPRSRASASASSRRPPARRAARRRPARGRRHLAQHVDVGDHRHGPACALSPRTCARRRTSRARWPPASRRGCRRRRRGSACRPCSRRCRPGA